jgi:hypothetical protein
MWTLLLIYLAGAVATWGGMNGISLVSGEEIDPETLIKKSLLSWYGFGMLILIVLSEIGQQIDKKP